MDRLRPRERKVFSGFMDAEVNIFSSGYALFCNFCSGFGLLRRFPEFPDGAFCSFEKRV